MHPIVQQFTQQFLRPDLPDFRPGDTIQVHSKIKEGNKERVQVFEGIVLKRQRGRGINGNFTVRKISSGIGVERTFMLHSPMIEKIVPVREGSVRRAKLYYLRDQKGSRMKVKQRSFHQKSRLEIPSQKKTKKQAKAAQAELEEVQAAAVAVAEVMEATSDVQVEAVEATDEKQETTSEVLAPAADVQNETVKVSEQSEEKSEK